MAYKRVNAVLRSELPMPVEATMGGRIGMALKVKGMSQGALARLLKVSKMTVSQWVRGQCDPRPENLLNIAALLFDGDVRLLVHGKRREPKGGFPTLNNADDNPQEQHPWRRSLGRSSAR